MARMRSIKPEFWADQDLTRLPRDVRLLYVALWNQCDEQSRMQGDPRLVKSWCFPLDDDVTAAVIDGWLDVLVAAGKVVRYEMDGSQYLHLPKLPAHQKLDPRLDSRLPAPPDPADLNVNTDQSVRAGVENAEPPPVDGAKHVAGGKGQVASSRGQETRGARLDPDWTPSPEVIDAMRTEGIPDDMARRELPRFRDYWIAQPGVKGRKSDWNATWRNWLRRTADGTAHPPSGGAASSKAAGWLNVDHQPHLQALGGTA